MALDIDRDGKTTWKDVLLFTLIAGLATTAIQQIVLAWRCSG